MSKNIKNLLSSLKNALLINSENIIISKNYKTLDTLNTLYKNGFIQSYKICYKKIIIFLRYLNNKPPFKTFKFLIKTINSKNLSFKNICKLSNKNATLFISTPKGLFTTTDCKKKKISGKTFFLLK
jgi:ribosomal protein S8